MKKNNVIAIIPARADSIGVPKKNIRTVGGYPLIAYSIIAARLSKLIKRVVVSTNSREIAKIAVSFGAEVPFLRPEAISLANSTDKEFVYHAINWFHKKEKNVPEYLVHLRPTTPLRDPTVIDRAIVTIRKNGQATSLQSAHLAPETPWKWFSIQRGYFRDIEGNLPGERLELPRQFFSQTYIPNGYVDVLRVPFVMSSRSLHGDKILTFITPRCTEVDVEDDLNFLFYEVARTKNKVYSYLKKNYPLGNSRVRHIGIVVRNIKRSFSFYTDMLGLKVVSRNIESGKYIDKLVGLSKVKLEWVKMADSDNGLVELLQYHSHPDPDVSKKPFNFPSYRLGCSHVALTVDNLDFVYDRLVKNGCHCNSRPLFSPDRKVKVLYCHDPDGVLVELVEENKG